ncbi:MAG: SDR family NAD(P)-dependent oxidoreductase [Candidatus Binatia bacterium]
MIEGLRDKVVIVTGGGHGIGKAYCLGFGRVGSRVVVADIDGPAAEEVASQVTRETRTESLGIKVDVADEDSTRQMAALAVERYSRIDVLVNNAAIFATVPMNRGGIESIDPEEWDHLIAVNLKGPFFCSRAVLPTMRAQRSGKIINIASGTVFSGSAGRIHYVTSKAGTIGFTRTLAREVGDANIQVNVLAPGSTLSEEHPSEEVMRFRQASIQTRALKRVQVPQDVVGAMLFLASSLSDFITGQTLNVDGGISML